MNWRKLITGWMAFILTGCATTCGAQQLMVIASAYLHASDTTSIYRPVDYDASKTYPTVILLHGYGGNYTSWSHLGKLQQLADQYHFIIACPDGLRDSWYINAPDKNGVQWESFFIDEFLPTLRKTVRVDTTKLIITGNSMGGHGAMWLMVRHPELFFTAASTSGVVNLRYSGYRNTSLAKLLGKYGADNQAFDTYSSVNYLSNLVSLNKYLLFDCGTEDHLYKANQQFRDSCDALKIKAMFISQPGRHQSNYWAYSIVQQFQFFDHLLKKEIPDMIMTEEKKQAHTMRAVLKR